MKDICNTLYKAFYTTNIMPFLISDESLSKNDIKIVSNKYNLLQSKTTIDLSDNSKIYNSRDGIDMAIFICSLFGFDTKKTHFKKQIHQLLLKEAAKKVIRDNGGLVLN